MAKRAKNLKDNVFKPIITKANDAVLIAEIDESNGPGFRIVYTNDTFSRIFGYAPEEVLGQSPRMLQGPETDARIIKEISTKLHRGEAIRRRILNYGKNGQSIWIDANIVPLPSHDGQIRRFAAIEREITAEVQREHRLEELAFADPLTKLANRRSLEQTMTRELSRARRTRQPLCFVVLDIDHFKAVNDTWGHPVGDQVLVAVANAVQQTLRIYDYAARIGGEEFAVVLPGAAPSDSMSIVNRLREQIHAKAQVVVDNQVISVTCSAGLTALIPGDTFPTLMHRADHALYEAKRTGRNRVCEIYSDISEPVSNSA